MFASWIWRFNIKNIFVFYSQNLLTSEQSCIILKSITKLPLELAPIYFPTLLTIIWENSEAEAKLAKEFDIQVSGNCFGKKDFMEKFECRLDVLGEYFKSVLGKVWTLPIFTSDFYCFQWQTVVKIGSVQVLVLGVLLMFTKSFWIRQNLLTLFFISNSDVEGIRKVSNSQEESSASHAGNLKYVMNMVLCFLIPEFSQSRNVLAIISYFFSVQKEFVAKYSNN